MLSKQTFWLKIYQEEYVSEVKLVIVGQINRLCSACTYNAVHK